MKVEIEAIAGINFLTLLPATGCTDHAGFSVSGCQG